MTDPKQRYSPRITRKRINMTRSAVKHTTKSCFQRPPKTGRILYMAKPKKNQRNLLKRNSDKGTRKDLEHRRYEENLIPYKHSTTQKIYKLKTNPSTNVSPKTMRCSPSLNIINISVYLQTLNHQQERPHTNRIKGKLTQKT